jgi:hypothetical protein
MSRFTFALVALALAGGGCGKSSNPTSPPATEKAAKMTEHKLDGAWRSSVADAPLQLTAAAAGYTIDWTFTTDSDNHLDGALASQDDHTWRGTVHLKAGDDSKDVPLTLRLDPAGKLRMELPAMFADPIELSRGEPARDPAAKADCVAQALDVLAATTAYKKLDTGGRHLQAMKDGETSHDRVCDVRVFVDGDGGETQTVGRFRVDFKAKQVLQYNPAEDSYTPLTGTAELFK